MHMSQMAEGLFLNYMFPSSQQKQTKVTSSLFLSHTDASEKLLDQELERVAPFAAHAFDLQATLQHIH